MKRTANVDLFSTYLNRKEKILVSGYVSLINAVGGKSNRIEELDKIISSYREMEEIHKGSMFAKFLYFFNEINDYEKANAVFKNLELLYPTDIITETASTMLSDIKIAVGEKVEKKENNKVSYQF
ncbi:MAG: hypothetical protein KJ799_06150 [Bacteroidetes bacterium]|nr:hypothetical protein [Bacteroidota bacterium]